MPEQRFADAGVMSIEHSDFDGTARTSPRPFLEPSCRSIEHSDFDGTERLALVLDGDIVSTFDTPERVKLGSCAQKRKTESCPPASAREDTDSAGFSRIPL